MGKNYLYLSSTLDAHENLAFDEWFLDHVAPEDLILYFYVNENAVIIGRNQNPLTECDLNAMRRDGVQLVRRVSGGGAVYHDKGNLNFSFNAGSARYDKEKQQRLILRAVESLGVPCSFSGRNDLLAQGRKFSGNAYCTRGGSGQHHGTLLVDSDMSRLARYLTVDPRKIASKGVSSVRSRVCNLKDLSPKITVESLLRVIPEAFQQEYGEFSAYPFREEDLEEIRRRYLPRHQSKEWLYGQTPPFDVSVDERLALGGVRLLLQLKDGKIARVTTYTDANDPDLPRRFEEMLTGIPFTASAVRQALAPYDDFAQLREALAAQAF